MERPTILIVDDQAFIRITLRSTLPEYRVFEAASGTEALEQIKQATPDLILLDLNMPGMDGYTMLSILKDAIETRLIPVIILTSLDEVEEKIKCLELGADDYVTKPFNFQELRARVSSLLRAKSRHEELHSIQGFVQALMKALVFRDRPTAAHSQRTAFYAMLLARGLSDPSPKEMHTAGLLHDIGKIGIREDILGKTTELQPFEFELIKFHPLLGERICSPVSGLQAILPAIRHHHERWDGSGYPDGLSAASIPLGARIIAIAESFDTMTNTMRYRPALPARNALELLRLGAGSQWDPKLVEVFCALIEEMDRLPTEEFALSSADYSP